MRILIYFFLAVLLVVTVHTIVLAQAVPGGNNPADPSKPEDNEKENEEDKEKEPEEKLTKLEKLIRELMSDSPVTRNSAINELAKMGEKAIPELNEILGVSLVVEQPEIDEDLKKKIELLIKQLDSEDWSTRENATKELEKIGEPAEIYLRRVAEFGTPEAKTRAEKILEKFEKEKRGGVSVEEHDQKMFWAKLGALKALGKIESDQVYDGLLAALSENDKMLSTYALLQLREKTGWSLGYGPGDLIEKKNAVKNKWSDFLKNPTTPESETECELLHQFDEGQKLRTSASWHMDSLSTTRTITRRVVAQGQGKQNKTEEQVTEYTYITEIIQQQNYLDEIEKAAEGILEFTREYTTHKSGSNYRSRRAGQQFFPNAPTLTDSNLALAELKFRYMPGFCELESLKGNIRLDTREWLSNNNLNFALLMPDGKMSPGETWKIPDLSALKFLNAASPQGINIFDLSSIDFECRLLEVEESEKGRKAKVAITVKFGPVQQQQNRIGGIRISSVSYGYGRMISLAEKTLVGDCVIDLDSNLVTEFKLFGTLFDTPEPNTRITNRRQEQNAVGHFNIEIKTREEE